jgi:hypothetical protein
MFSRWIETNITSARGTLHCSKTRSPCVDLLVICGLYTDPPEQVSSAYWRLHLPGTRCVCERMAYVEAYDAPT